MFARGTQPKPTPVWRSPARRPARNARRGATPCASARRRGTRATRARGPAGPGTLATASSRPVWSAARRMGGRGIRQRLLGKGRSKSQRSAAIGKSPLDPGGVPRSGQPVSRGPMNLVDMDSYHSDIISTWTPPIFSMPCAACRSFASCPSRRLNVWSATARCASSPPEASSSGRVRPATRSSRSSRAVWRCAWRSAPRSRASSPCAGPATWWARWHSSTTSRARRAWPPTSRCAPSASRAAPSSRRCPPTRPRPSIWCAPSRGACARATRCRSRCCAPRPPCSNPRTAA